MLKKILIGIGIVVVAIFIALMVVNISSYRSQDIKTETQGIYTVYKDEKFGYSFKYPANWTKTNGAPVNQGYVDVTTPDKVTQIQFWYKDSGKLSSLNDLKKFVENDVKYAEENGGFKTVSLSIEELNGEKVVVLAGVTPQGEDKFYHKQYYIADLNPTSDQYIFVWNINIVSKNSEEPSNTKEIDKILQSVKFDKYPQK